jgi:lipoate-protein ligase A
VRESWRLLVHGALDGRLNMAIDRAVQLARDEGSAPPTLRLYRWSRPTLTLGRFQSLTTVDTAECARAGVDVARRFTGGRGVLHDEELTYAVVAGVDDGVPRGVAASYRYLCAALIEAYAQLGVRTELVTRESTARSAGACYLQSTRADLAAADAKVSGSAQVWRGETVLQHGSFVVHREMSRESKVFRLDRHQLEHLSKHTRTLLELTGRRPTYAAIECAVVTGFERALGVRFAPAGLTAREAELAAGLAEDTSPDRVPARFVRG